MPLAGTYRPRQPENTAFYQCLEDYWDEFKKAYPYFYEKDYEPWRPGVEKTVERFLPGGILRHGFARLRCSLLSSFSWPRTRSAISPVPPSMLLAAGSCTSTDAGARLV